MCDSTKPKVKLKLTYQLYCQSIFESHTYFISTYFLLRNSCSFPSSIEMEMRVRNLNSHVFSSDVIIFFLCVCIELKQMQGKYIEKENNARMKRQMNTKFRFSTKLYLVFKQPKLQYMTQFFCSISKIIKLLL